MTRLLFISTSYPVDAKDWKGRFIADMASALASRPDLKLTVWAPPGELPPQAQAAITPGDRAWLNHLSAQGGIATQVRRGMLHSLAPAASLLFRLHRAYRRERYDIAHVNWLQNALPLWGTRKPALVTVLGSDYGLLDRPGMVAALRTVFAQRPTILAPNATWMVPRLEVDFGTVAQIRPVPFGVGHHWFEVDRSQARPDCWIAVTRLTRNKIGNLFEWGEGLFGGDRQLHLFGPMQEPMALPGWINWHGPTHPADMLDNWFPKATGLISLSRHDEGRPQVMLEAMAAGLPVVASDLPAHRDFLRHGETGWLVEDREALGSALTDLEDMAHNRRIGLAARNRIKQEIGDWADCAARYAALYTELEAHR
jgi:glycosyltransferase involved in cell wall biosynthesis